MIKQVIEELKATQKTMSIATLDSDNYPCVSYAPFVFVDNKILFIISKTAPHYDNIMLNSGISINIIEDENKAENIFFRKRLTIQGQARQLSNKENVLDILTDGLGKMIPMLFKMDFEVFELTFTNAKIVYGPGKAFFLDDHLNLVAQDSGSNNLDLEDKPFLLHNENIYLLLGKVNIKSHFAQIKYKNVSYNYEFVEEADRLKHIFEHFKAEYQLDPNEQENRVLVLKKID